MNDWIMNLPSINAGLNALSAIFLVGSFIAIRHGRPSIHRALISLALVSSSLFLLGYLWFHWNVGVVRFAGAGVIRAIYFVLLSTHTALAASLLPLIGFMLVTAIQGRREGHRRFGRFVVLTWLYVSVSGVAIYFFLRPIQVDRFTARPTANPTIVQVVAK